MAAISIVLLLAILILHFKTVFLFGLFSAHQAGANDITTLYFPSRFFFGNSLRTGEFPLWNNNMFLGFPIHAEGQGGFFYPLNIIFAIFPQWIAYNYIFLMHVFLGGFFMYLFLREIKLKKIPSLLSSFIFIFSGFFACHAEHMNLFNSCIWIPLGFLFVLKKQYLCLSLIFALQLLTGFPQIAFYSGIILFFWQIFNIRKFKEIVRLFLSSILGILIAFCQVLPTIELIPHSIRSKGINPHDMFSWGYYLKDMLLFIHPYIFGNPVLGTYTRKDSIFCENCVFIGIMTILLVILSIIKNKSLGVKRIGFFAGLSIGIIVFLLVFPIISDLVLYIPGFKFFRLPQRFLVFIVFSLSILAAYGFQSLKRLKIPVLFIILLELINFGSGYNKVLDMEYFNIPYSVKFLKKDADIFRVFVLDAGKKAWISNYVLSTMPETNYISQKGYLNYLPPNTNIIFDIPVLNIYSPLKVVDDSEYSELAKSNVKYILSSANLSDKEFVLAEKIYLPLFLPSLKIYKNRNYFSHAFFEDEKKQKKESLRILQYSSNKVKIEKNINFAGTVTLLDFNYPGWSVFVDGSSSKMYTANAMTRSVKVSRSSKKIDFIFLSESFIVGVWISIFAIFVVFCVLGIFDYENTCY
ncbi:MAG: hypothetical protein HY919_03955 [Elusimicrobia bacterium]|nr:hypothetical protein [Elusimicrobiota bacterium]